MPIDPVVPTFTGPPAKAPQKSLNDARFGALVNQELKTGLKPGPKLAPDSGDGFKSLAQPERFISLNKNLVGAPTPPLTASTVEALGATTKHPLGPQKR